MAKIASLVYYGGSIISRTEKVEVITIGAIVIS